MNIKVIKTIKNKKTMQETKDFTVLEDNGREACFINVFPDIEYQEIKGFGGAFSEAASTTLDKLGKENR